MILSARAAGGALRGLTSAVPVDPDAATARRWARDELLDPIYHSQRSLLSRLLDWIFQQLDSLRAPGAFSPVAIALVVAVVVAVVVIAFLLNGPVRRSRKVRSARDVLDADDARTSEQIRAAADAAAAREDWTLAVIERFRALVRGFEERTVLDERAARTAHEAAQDAAARLPGLGADLVSAGRLFDDVAYGHEPATRDDDGRLRELDARARATRPVAPGRGSTAVPVPR